MVLFWNYYAHHIRLSFTNKYTGTKILKTCILYLMSNKSFKMYTRPFIKRNWTMNISLFYGSISFIVLNEKIVILLLYSETITYTWRYFLNVNFTYLLKIQLTSKKLNNNQISVSSFHDFYKLKVWSCDVELII